MERLNKTYFSNLSIHGREDFREMMFMNLVFCNINRRWINCDRIFFLKCQILRKNIPEILADFDIKRLPTNLESKATKFIEKFSEINVAEKRLGNIKDLLTLINEFLNRAMKKREVELDSLLFYLFYCILMASPRNMVSDVKLLYMSLPKEQEIRILGNLAVQLLASLQFLSKFISDLCRELLLPNSKIYDRSEVKNLRSLFNLEDLETPELQRNDLISQTSMPKSEGIEIKELMEDALQKEELEDEYTLKKKKDMLRKLF